MLKFGEVIGFDEKSGKAEIRYVRPDACAKCGACKSLNQNGSIKLKADCAVGNWVQISLPDGKFLSAAVLSYFLPLVGLLAGMLAGYFLSGHRDLWTVVGALLGVGVCLLILIFVEKRISGNPEWTPQIVKVYESKPDMSQIGCDGMKE